MSKPARLRETVGVMRVKIEEVGVGQHPREKLVKIETTEGPEELVVDGRSIQQHSLEVGYVGQHNRHLLVELPSETFKGVWRVWVDRDIVIVKGSCTP